LSGINALNSCEPAQLQQLITQLKSELDIEGEPPSVYQEKIELLVEQSLKEVLRSSNENSITAKDKSIKEAKPTDNIEEKIKIYCEKEWPDDYSMRVHCIKEQRAAASKMNEARPDDIAVEVYKDIIQKSINEWPEDYSMQVHSKDEQIEAYRELKKI